MSPSRGRTYNWRSEDRSRSADRVDCPGIDRITSDRSRLIVRFQFSEAVLMPEPDERSRAIIDGLEAIDPQYVLHLPSSTLTHIINHMLARPNTTTFPIPREEEGVGILAGLELA